VVFLGYSLPTTDIAAGFLFREGLGHLKTDAITVVDFARDDAERSRKLPSLLAAYRNVFPAIHEDQFQFLAPWPGSTITSSIGFTIHEGPRSPSTP
jgi:hypothetical protein